MVSVCDHQQSDFLLFVVKCSQMLGLSWTDTNTLEHTTLSLL